jgi:hypothetical protein
LVLPVPDNLLGIVQQAERLYWQARTVGDQLLYLGYSEIAVDSTHQPAQKLASHGEDVLAQLELVWLPIPGCGSRANMFIF